MRSGAKELRGPLGHPVPPLEGGPWDDDLQGQEPRSYVSSSTIGRWTMGRRPSGTCATATSHPANNLHHPLPQGTFPRPPPALPAPPPLQPCPPIPPAHPPCSCSTSDPTPMGPGCWRGEGGERTGGVGWGGSGGGCGTGRGGAGGARRAGPSTSSPPPAPHHMSGATSQIDGAGHGA